MTHRDILTPAQRSVLGLLAMEEDLAAAYTLSGGTALAAFHLFHRRSDDLDFFSMDPVDELRVHRFMETVRGHVGASAMEARRIYDRHLFVLSMMEGDALKLEFTHYPYAHVEKTAVHNGVRVESLRDIATDKLAAMLDRFEPKDYYDLYCLLQGNHASLEQMRADVQTKFHITTDPVQLGAAFARSDSLPILPHMLVPVRKEDVQAFFKQLSRGLRPEIAEE